MILTPKNWKSFQHYKDRAPAWIKLHKALLDDYEFSCLPIASKALAPMLWLLASEYDDGRIDASLDKIAFRLRLTRGELADALSPLLEKGFFNASEPLAACEQTAIPEKEDIGKRNIEKSERENGAVAPFDPAVPEREFFFRGREVLGKGAGGLIGKLLKSKGGNVALARAALEQASQKENPTEYVAAICRGPPVSAKPLTEHQRKQAEAREILDEIGSAIRGGSSEGNFGTLRHDTGGGPESIRGGVGGNLIALPASGHRSGR